MARATSPPCCARAPRGPSSRRRPHVRATSAGSPGMTTFVALLRSINVGGRNRVPMADLAGLVGSLGFGDVDTYLQSGNVVFTGSGTPDAAAAGPRAGIADRLGLEIPVIVRSSPSWPGCSRTPPTRDLRVDPKTLHVTFLAESARRRTAGGSWPGSERSRAPGAPSGTTASDWPVRRLPLLPGWLRRDQAQQRLLRAPVRRGGHHPELADGHHPGRHGRRSPSPD